MRFILNYHYKGIYLHGLVLVLWGVWSRLHCRAESQQKSSFVSCQMGRVSRQSEHLGAGFQFNSRNYLGVLGLGERGKGSKGKGKGGEVKLEDQEAAGEDIQWILLIEHWPKYWDPRALLARGAADVQSGTEG